MELELNQVQDMTDNEPVEVEEEGLFDNILTDLEKPAEEETSVEEVVETAEEVVEKEEPETFLEIKYNKEPRNLTKDEAIELAQKGMNYDNILGKYNALKDNESMFEELNRLAKLNNLSLNDYVKNLSDVQEHFELNKEIEALKEKYPESDDSLIEELARTHLMTRENLESAKKQEQENAQKQEIEKWLDKFSSRYPDVDPSKLDKSVYDKIKEGYTLMEAYDIYLDGIKKEEDKKAESLETIKKINDENKAKSLGNIGNQENASESDQNIFAKYLGL